MTDSAREARNRYMREYRKKNKERIKEINDRFWERRAIEESCETIEIKVK